MKTMISIELLAMGMQELILIVPILIIFIIIPLISLWKLYEKAEQPGWAAIVPFYNLIILMKIIDKPWWWALLCMIPYLGAIWGIWSTNLLVKRFGKSEGFTIGVLFLGFIFLPMLAFGDSRYIKSNEE
jgi:hypothetical protein